MQTGPNTSQKADPRKILNLIRNISRHMLANKEEFYKSEGIFRLPGNKTHIDEIVRLIGSGNNELTEKTFNNKKFEINDYASALKAIRNIPLFNNNKHIKALKDIVKLPNDQQAEAFRDFISELAQSESLSDVYCSEVLYSYCKLLKEISGYSNVNKMTRTNIAIASFGPGIYEWCSLGMNDSTATNTFAANVISSDLFLNPYLVEYGEENMKVREDALIKFEHGLETKEKIKAEVEQLQQSVTDYRIKVVKVEERIHDIENKIPQDKKESKKEKKAASESLAVLHEVKNKIQTKALDCAEKIKEHHIELVTATKNQEILAQSMRRVKMESEKFDNTIQVVLEELVEMDAEFTSRSESDDIEQALEALHNFQLPQKINAVSKSAHNFDISLDGLDNALEQFSVKNKAKSRKEPMRISREDSQKSVKSHVSRRNLDSKVTKTTEDNRKKPTK